MAHVLSAHDSNKAFRHSQRLVKKNATRNQLAQYQRAGCGFHTDCPRPYSLASINESAAQRRDIDPVSEAALRMRHEAARRDCARQAAGGAGALTGLIVATQRGAAAWMHAAAGISAEQAAMLLRALDQLGGRDEGARGKRGGHGDSDADGEGRWLDPQRLAATANQHLLDHPDESAVQWLVREACHQRCATDSPPLGQTMVSPALHGHARCVWVRPQGWDVVLCADGLEPIRLPMGCLVKLEIEPDRQLWDHQVQVKLGGM